MSYVPNETAVELPLVMDYFVKNGVYLGVISPEKAIEQFSYIDKVIAVINHSKKVFFLTDSEMFLDSLRKWDFKRVPFTQFNKGVDETPLETLRTCLDQNFNHYKRIETNEELYSLVGKLSKEKELEENQGELLENASVGFDQFIVCGVLETEGKRNVDLTSGIYIQPGIVEANQKAQDLANLFKRPFTVFGRVSKAFTPE